MNNAIIENNSLIEDFVSLITKGIECWTKAGEIVVKLIDEHGFSIQSISSASTYLTDEMVGRFEQLGRKQIIPNLLVSDFPASKHLFRLPYSEQKRLIDGQVELLVVTDKGTETLMVDTENLTSAQCKQVFDKNALRSIGGQRAYMESKKEEFRISSVIHDSEPFYKVRGKRVIFTKACEITSRQLAQILAEIE
jgi:hypothetical protein